MDGSRSESFVQGSTADGYSRVHAGPVVWAWAGELTARANLAPGCWVLDVASGRGPVARLAAQAAGPGGRAVGAARRCCAGLAAVTSASCWRVRAIRWSPLSWS